MASNKLLPFQRRSPASRRWFEQLEQRRLLSISPVDYAAMPLTTFDQNNSALVGGLSAVANWSKQLDSYGAVGATVPLLGESLGHAANFADALGSQFEMAVQNYLANTHGASADELAAFLNNYSQWVLAEPGLTLTAKVGDPWGSPPGTSPPATSPPTLAATPQPTSGAQLAQATYDYEVTAITASGETAASNEKEVIVSGSNNSVALSWNAVSGATAYKIYRGTTSGQENVVIGEVSSAAATSFTDVGDQAALVGNDLLIGVDLHVARTSTVPLNFSTELGTSAPIGVTASANGSLTAGFDFQFSFGLDLTPFLDGPDAQRAQIGNQPSGATPPALFVLQAGSFTASADLSASNINAQAHAGLLAGTVTGGTATIDDNLTLALPSGDLRTADFSTPSLFSNPTAGHGLQPSGTVSVSLPFKVGAQIGGTTFTAANDALTIGPTSLYNPDGTLATPAFSVSGGDASTIDLFQNFSASDVQNALVQLGGWAAGLGSSSAMATPVPFTGKTLGQLVNIQAAYNQALAALLPGSNSGGPPFNTIQDLLTDFPGIFSGVTLTGNELTVKVHVAATLPAVVTPLSFNSAGSLTGFTTTSTLTLSPTAGLDFTLGIDLNPLGTDSPNKLSEPIDPSKVTLSQLNAGSGVTFNVGLTAANSLPANQGRLPLFGPSGAPQTDAIASNLVINGEAIPVMLAGTQSDNNLGDLVANLQHAINASLAPTPFANSITAADESGTIVLEVLSTAGAKITSLSVENATASNAGALGFDGSQAAVSQNGNLVVTAANPFPGSNGQLPQYGDPPTDLALFALVVNGKTVPVTVSGTQKNNSLADLVTELNTAALPSALAGTPFSGDIQAEDLSGTIAFVASSAASSGITSLEVVSPNELGAAALGFDSPQQGVAQSTDATLESGSPVLTAANPFPFYASFGLTINGQSTPYSIAVDGSGSGDDSSVTSVVSQVNTALSAALATTPFAGAVEAQAIQDPSGNSYMVLAAAVNSPGQVSPATSLSISDASALGFSDGQTQPTDADLMITLHNGQTKSVSLRGLGESATLAAVFQAINTATGGTVTGQVYEDASNANDALDGRAIVLTDHSSGTGQFTISAANGSLAGVPTYGLGIIGTEGPDGTIVSGPLDGDSPLDHIFVQNVSANASLSASLTNINATANLGIVSVGVSGGSLHLDGLNNNGTSPLAATVMIDNADGTPDGSPLSLADLANLLNPNATSSGPNLSLAVTGNATLSLPVTVASPLLHSSGAAGTVEVDWSAAKGFTVKPITGPLANLSSLSDQNVLGAVSDAVSKFVTGDIENNPLQGVKDVLTTNLPLVNKSLDNLIDPGGSLLAALTSLPVVTGVNIIGAGDFGFTSTPATGQLTIAADSPFGNALGRLTKDENFTVVVTGAVGQNVSFPVTVLAAQTTGNLSFADLVAELDTAIASALAMSPYADALTFSDVGGTLVLTAAPLAFDALVAKLQKTLGGAVTVSFDQQTQSLKFDLQFAPPPVNESTSLNLDFESLAKLDSGDLSWLGDISSLLGVGASGDLSLHAAGNLKLDLGLDLADAADPQPFVYGDTSLVLSALASATNINANATLGGLVGVSIKNGSASLSDPASTQKPATFTLGLTDAGGSAATQADRFYFTAIGNQTALSASNIAAAANGAAQATLPISSNALGATDSGTLSLNVPKLGDALSGIAGSVTISASPGLQNGLSNLGSLLANSDNTLSVLGEGLSLALDQVQQSIDASVFAKALPLVGAGLQSIDFAGDLWDGPLAQLTAAIDNATVTPQTEATVVQLAISAAFNLPANSVIVTPTANGIQVSLDLSGSDSASLSFSTGLSSMPLSSADGASDVWPTSATT